MEGKTIQLIDDEYMDLKKILASDQENIYFQRKYTDELISIPNPTTEINHNKTSNAKNIVEVWINDINEMAAIGYQERDFRNSREHFSKIMTYCKAVIASIKSS